MTMGNQYLVHINWLYNIMKGKSEIYCVRGTMPISRLEKLQLRELWKHEAYGFTQWLAENLDFVSDTIGINLSLVEREAPAGPFSVDILAEDPQGHQVVIENQLEQTNHDHLGKLITYMSNLDAKTAIWITSNPRPEHEKAVHWLNETLPEDTSFYLIKIEAFHIGNSDPAPFLTIVAGPSVAGRQAGEEKKELAQRLILRQSFWEQLLELAKKKCKLFERISPSTENWISAGAGKSGLNYAFVIRMADAHVELYIDKANQQTNKLIFDQLYKKKEQIEEKFGAPLEWQRLDVRRSCRIRFLILDSGLLDQENWPTLQAALVEAMVRLIQTFEPEIQKISL